MVLVTYFVIITRVLRNNHYEKPDDFIYDDDDYYDAVDGDGNNTDFITDVELEVQSTQYTKAKRHVLSSHFQIIQADGLR